MGDKATTKRIERQLAVPMGEELAETRSQEMAQLVCEQTAIETELAAYGADKRKRLREIRKRVKELATSIKDRTELAMVQCTEERLFAQNRLLVKRLDTGAVVEDRALSGEERQIEIDGTEEKVRTRKGKARLEVAPA